MVERWDLMLVGALVITAVILPLDVSLLKGTSSNANGLIHFTDFIFLTDMILQFNLAYTNVNPQATGGAWEVRPSRIALRYMAFPCSQSMEAGWFWPDLFTLIPWDNLLWLLDIRSGTMGLIRLLRFLRVLRLVRVLKLFNKWHTRAGVSMALMKIATCAIITLLLVHWLACFWAHLGSHPEHWGESQSWLTHYIGDDVDLTTVSMYQKFYSSFYFVTVVLTTVGFGDAVPVNHVEVIAMTVTILMTGVTWAWVVGNIVNVITNLDAFGNIFNAAMDDLNSLMKTYGVSNMTRVRIRKHLHESYHVQKQKHARESAFAWLSEGLKGELAIESGGQKICEAIWYFRDVSQNVIIELADEFKANLFSPNETVHSPDSASVILRGSCLKSGRLLTRGSCYGEDMILCSQHLKDTSSPVSLSFLEVMSIHRDDLMQACEKYPEFNRRLRKAQIKLAVWRSFLFLARQMKAEQRASRGALSRANSSISNGRRSAWDQGFFSIGAMSFSAKNPALSRPGWKESFVEDGPTGDSGDAKLDSVDMRMQQVLEAVQSIRDDVALSRQETQIQLCSFGSRFDQLEQEVVKVNEKIEVIGRELQRGGPSARGSQAADGGAGSKGSMFGSIVGARSKSPKS